MLPPKAVEILGLGLQDISPALSFGLRLNAAGEIKEIEIHPSWVRVERLSYKQAENRLDEIQDLRSLNLLAQVYQKRRQANGALFIDLPEIIIRVVDGQVSIRPLVRYRSRDLVREAMLMAGEAAARFAIENQLPFPFATQEGPAKDANPQLESLASGNSLASSFAMRRLLKRSRVSGRPAPHAGVGLPAYSRATSPLRRYLDLAVHQQLRRHILGQALIDEQTILEAIGHCESVIGSVNQAESLSRRHWTLVYLLQNPKWQGQGVVVEKRQRSYRIIIPELALEFNLNSRQELTLDDKIPLKLKGVNLPELEAHFSLAM
jgi:exoribonuclease-2